MSKNLPVYKTLEYTTTLPLSGQVVSYRPYNVGDERNLIAAQSAKDDDPSFYITNTIKVIQGAVMNGVDIGKLPAVDVRFLLLKQRAKSVGEIVEFQVDKKPVSFNIDDLYVKGKREKKDFEVNIGNGYFLKMQDLTFADETTAASSAVKGKEHDVFYSLIVSSINSIYTQEEVWVVGQDISKEDAQAFLFGIPKESAKPIYDFIESSPSIAVDIEIDGKKQTFTDKEIDFLGSVSAT